MQPAGRLPVQPWMTARETVAVLSALGAEGQTVRFVGGCVRDAFLGRPVADVDFATPDPPASVVRLLEKAGIQGLPTGIAHGTVTAVAGADHFEVTTLRRDVETDGRRAKVAFTDDWAGDAARRDFTINALYCDADGTLYDPTGGLNDLAAGRIRFIGAPDQRIREDVLRILRFFRFHAWYGRAAVDADGLAACRMLADRLATLSGERMAGEMFRLLDAPAPSRTLGLMAGAGVLAQVLPEADERDRLTGLTRLCRLETGELAPDHLRRLAALIALTPANTDRVAARLKLSNAQRDRLRRLAAPAPAVQLGMTPKQARAAVYRMGRGAFTDVLLLRAAEDAAPASAVVHLLDSVRGWQPPEVPVRGEDVEALGVSRGPVVGRLLARIEAWWVASDFRPGRAEALAKLKSLIPKR